METKIGIRIRDFKDLNNNKKILARDISISITMEKKTLKIVQVHSCFD